MHPRKTPPLLLIIFSLPLPLLLTITLTFTLRTATTTILSLRRSRKRMRMIQLSQPNLDTITDEICMVSCRVDADGFRSSLEREAHVMSLRYIS